MVERIVQCWVVSVPGGSSEDSPFQSLKEAVEKFKGCSVTKFHVPPLKVGDFDGLVRAATEEIPKLENECEGLVGKIGASLATVLEKTDLGLDDVKVAKTTLKGYLLTFTWDETKYPTGQNLNTIVSLINKQVKQTDALRESQMRRYMTLRDQLTNCQKKKLGPLTTRNYLGDLISPEDFISESKFMKTYLAIVPNHLKESWYYNYEWLHDEVVPRSTKLITEETDYTLFTVVAFVRCEKQLRENARKRGFYIRDYVFAENEKGNYNDETDMLQNEKLKQKSPLINWLMISFSDVYIAYCHLKAVRLHIESILRYGPTDNYQAAVLILDENQEKKVRGVLETMYSSTSNVKKRSKSKKISAVEDIFDAGEYYPYVCSRVKICLQEFVKK